MINKKRISALVIGIMLVSLTIATIPTVTAYTPVDIWGYVHINGVATNPDSVSLIFQGYSPISADLLGGGGYKFIFDVEDYGFTGSLSGTFDIVYSGQTWTAPQTVTITGSDSFYINLTDGPPMFSNPSPSDGKKSVSTGTSSLSITIQDPDGDNFDWTITTSPNIGSNSNIVDSNGTKTCSISGVSSSTKYTWTVSATDGTYWTNISYTFTTKSSGGGGGGGSGGGGGGGNIVVKPDADAGGPYEGFINEDITFDGSSSSDDGTITSYSWDFGDGNSGSGETTTHTYSNPGIYTIKLTVTDNELATDTDTTTATILIPNTPPEDPIISGPEDVELNKTYNFTFVSTDDDNHTIQYTIDWGDGQSDITDFVPNGTEVTLNHLYSEAGNYTIQATAYDNQTYSDFGEFFVSIEAEKEPEEPEPEEYDYTWLILLLILLIILIIIGYLISKRKKKPEEKKQPPKKSENKNKNTSKKKGKK